MCSSDLRTDIYALGATLFKLLVGQAPFANAGDGSLTAKVIAIASKPVPSVKQLRPDVPDELDQLVQSMLAKSPNDRPATAADVINALSAFCTEAASTEKLSQSRVRKTAAQAHAGRTSRTGLAVAAAVVATLSLIVFKLTLPSAHPQSELTSTKSLQVEEHSEPSTENRTTVSRDQETVERDVDRIAAEWAFSHRQLVGRDEIRILIHEIGRAHV